MQSIPVILAGLADGGGAMMVAALVDVYKNVTALRSLDAETNRDRS